MPRNWAFHFLFAYHKTQNFGRNIVLCYICGNFSLLILFPLQYQETNKNYTFTTSLSPILQHWCELNCLGIITHHKNLRFLERKLRKVRSTCVLNWKGSALASYNKSCSQISFPHPLSPFKAFIMRADWSFKYSVVTGCITEVWKSMQCILIHLLGEWCSSAIPVIGHCAIII